MKDKLQFIPLDKIIVGERFRKDLGDINNLIQSVKEKGIIQPITVDHDYNLMAGGRRLHAAKAVGLEKIPALIHAGDEIELREVELIENTFREDFTWQERANLIAELDRLMKEKHGKEWSVRKTAALLGQSHPMNVQRALQLHEAMEIPELKEEIMKMKTADEAGKFIKKFEEKIVVNEMVRRQSQIKSKGMQDMLRLADANYRIGDALKGMEPCKAIADFIEVDPPYGINLNEQKRKDSDVNTVASYNEVERVEYQAFTEIVAEQTFKAAKQDCWMVYWYGPTHHAMIYQALVKAGWQVDEIPAIWSKGNVGQTNAPEIYLARCYEPFFVCRKGKPAINKRGRSNVFEFSPTPATKKYHPTERPMALMAEILDVFTFEGSNSTVLVPFLGSGVTLRASYLRGHKCFGWDLNGEYKNKFMLAVEEDTKQLHKEE